jgi:hypothetical protein
MSWVSEYFTIGNKKSSDIGVDGFYIIRTDSGEINRTIIGEKNIIEEKVPYVDKPYFIRTEKSPIEFDLKFSLLDKNFNSDVLQEICDLFAKDRYVPFSSMDFPFIEFYVIATQINLVQFGDYRGWIQVHLRTSSPYGFTQKKDKIIDCTDATPLSPKVFEIYNKSNVQNAYGRYEYFPHLFIYLKNNSTDIQIRNLSNGNYLFGFENLTANESLEVDNELKQITSSTGIPRLGNMLNNHQWLYLGYGKNIFKCYNSCILQFQYQLPVYI